jgi:hypothetical protein
MREHFKCADQLEQTTQRITISLAQEKQKVAMVALEYLLRLGVRLRLLLLLMLLLPLRLLLLLLVLLLLLL